jgi:hypothetical protein
MAEMSGHEFTDKAKAYARAGRSVIPLRDLKTKKPAVQWSVYQRKAADIPQIQTWFSGQHAYPGMAVVTGRVSGNLQGLDFDCKNDNGASHEAWLDEVNRWAPSLIDRLVSETSQSGGMHYYFSCPEIAGGVTLAFTEPKPQTNEVTGEVKMIPQALIETKENGRYMACYPTPGYTMVHGNLTSVPEITTEERQILHDAARMQNKNFSEEKRGNRYTANPDQPGTQYSQKATIAEVLHMLVEHGWTEVRRG